MENKWYLPKLAVGTHEGSIVQGSAHHSWHARCTIEQIEEGLLSDVVQVHSLVLFLGSKRGSLYRLAEYKQ